MNQPPVSLRSPERGFRTFRSPESGNPLGYRTGPNQSGNSSAFTITFRPLTAGWRIPPIYRLRAALKRFKRDYGMVCTSCRPEEDR